MQNIDRINLILFNQKCDKIQKELAEQQKRFDDLEKRMNKLYGKKPA